MAVTIHNADIRAWAADYDGPRFHALLCDPPYHMASIVKRFGRKDSAPAQHGRDGAFARASRGFMGQSWDGGDIAFDSAFWESIGYLLYPGAFGLAFASSRGVHRMACAIEDAGFILHPTIWLWTYGSGFPKATRIDTQLDKQRGLTRPVIGDAAQTGAKFAHAADLMENGGFNDRERTTYDLTAPADEESAAWAGYRYGLQALKPAAEPIIMFQRPYEGNAVQSINASGAGALNIDGARIDNGGVGFYQEGKTRTTSIGGGVTYDGKYVLECSPVGHPAGRWPANFMLAHGPDCTGIACGEDCTVRDLGDQSGISYGGKGGYDTRPANDHSVARIVTQIRSGVHHGDSGTAARYFYQARWNDETADRISQSDAVRYVSKASTKEREAGLDGMPMIKTANGADSPRRNPHPTVKPLSLVRYLATLLLPPARYGDDRRILVPFAGVGSEMIGAMQAGWPEVVGVEMTAEYIPVAEARIAYWRDQVEQQSLFDEEV